jgi:hypothetical protein
MEVRSIFHKRLREIQDSVLVMGNMASKAIQRCRSGTANNCG